MAANFWVSSHCDLMMRRERKDKQGLKLESASTSIRNKQEKLLRLKVESVECIFKLGKSLKVRQVPLLTACVYIHRFYSEEENLNLDLDKHKPSVTTLSCVYLACKVEETPLTVEKLLKCAKGVFETDIASNDDIIEGELVVLNALSTSLVVHHPHQDTLNYVKSFGLENQLELIWHVIADSYHTDLCLHFPPHLIALGCIYMACGFEGKNLLPCMCTDLHVDENEVLCVCSEMVKFYKHSTK